jgi:hypothetical protein
MMLEEMATPSILAPFRLSLGDSLESVSSRLPRATRRGLRADEARYVELGLASDGSDTGSATGPLPSPAGTRVIEANLYFDSAETLIEASLVVELEHESDRVLLELKRLLGRPHFEVVLPGGVDTLVGWQASDGYLIGSFSDVPLFQLSAFRHEPDDLLTGSYLLLFEALADYSAGLDAGAPPGRLLRDLLEIVEWVEQARKLIEPLP